MLNNYSLLLGSLKAQGHKHTPPPPSLPAFHCKHRCLPSGLDRLSLYGLHILCTCSCKRALLKSKTNVFTAVVIYCRHRKDDSEIGAENSRLTRIYCICSNLKEKRCMKKYIQYKISISFANLQYLKRVSAKVLYKQGPKWIINATMCKRTNLTK